MVKCWLKMRQTTCLLGGMLLMVWSCDRHHKAGVSQNLATTQKSGSTKAPRAAGSPTTNTLPVSKNTGGSQTPGIVSITPTTTPPAANDGNDSLGGTGNALLGAKGASLASHPASCIEQVAVGPNNAAVSHCPDIIGTQQKNEGFCLVRSTVTPYWNNTIPSSGPAYTDSNWTFYGVFPPSKPLPRGNWVLNLANGYVVLLYNCAIGKDCSADVKTMEEAMTPGSPGYPTILTADPLLPPGTYAAVAWDWVYTFDSKTISQAALECFIKQHAFVLQNLSALQLDK